MTEAETRPTACMRSVILSKLLAARKKKKTNPQKPDHDRLDLHFQNASTWKFPAFSEYIFE